MVCETQIKICSPRKVLFKWTMNLAELRVWRISSSRKPSPQAQSVASFLSPPGRRCLIQGVTTAPLHGLGPTHCPPDRVVSCFWVEPLIAHLKIQKGTFSCKATNQCQKGHLPPVPPHRILNRHRANNATWSKALYFPLCLLTLRQDQVADIFFYPK